MWLKGMTFSAIGQQMEVSRQRVHELLVPPSQKRKVVYNLHDGQCAECGMFLSRNGHYHSIPTGPIDDFTQPMILLCCGCHAKRHRGGGL